MGKNKKNPIGIGLLLFIFYFLLAFHMNQGAMTVTAIFCLVILFTIAKKVTCNRSNVALLISYGIFLSLISYIKGLYDIASVVDAVFTSVCFYIFGKYVVAYYGERETGILRFLLLTVFFFGSYFYYWTIKDITETGQIISLNRWLTIEGEKAGATLIGTNVSLGLGGLAIFFVIRTKWVRWSFLFLWFLSLLSTIHMINRSGIIISIVCLAIVLIFYFRKSKHLMKVIFIIAVSFAIYLLISSNSEVQTVLDAYENREMGGDESTLTEGGGRTNRWMDGLMNIPTHPFGWDKSKMGYNYVHNMWIDVAKQAGWIPFLLLCIITFKIINNIRSLILRIHTPLSYTLLALNICIFLAALVEPIIGGVFFGCYCLIWGIGESYLGLYSKKRV